MDVFGPQDYDVFFFFFQEYDVATLHFPILFSIDFNFLN